MFISINSKKLHKKYAQIKQMQRERELLRTEIKKINDELVVNYNLNNNKLHLSLKEDSAFYEKQVHHYKQKIKHFFTKYEKEIELLNQRKKRNKEQRKLYKKLAQQIDANRYAINLLNKKEIELTKEIQDLIHYWGKTLNQNVDISVYVLRTMKTDIKQQIIRISKQQEQLKREIRTIKFD